MARSSVETQLDGLRETVNQDATQLIRHLRCSHAPEDALNAAISHIQQAIAVLKPWLKEGEGWSTISILAMANVVSGHAGFTGTLTIRYHRQTPLNTPVELFSETLRQDGRKQLSRGEMRVNGEVTASAEGLFISAAPKSEATGASPEA